ncbi:DNA mismatch repair endonuclease MutL [Erysipelothrix enhydrae]|uniref:DNA mismatch repair endonuclease MutL n=1 Tax=Erysipelothrix enhydrae TaxID=2890314 RepID=UPI002B2448E6|nr:DNA mismatch repair endonuclease MutL [Erysipelothrix sp. 4322-04]WRB87638.1 DNA mismatch repair endonuclease MutL [Erysipelothrix sp. 4322-04]
MNKIKVLDTHLTNMIAAGEVVERPAGIIKELVENSIDANATSIEVRIVEGGMGLIEVSDNGEGMSGEDLSQAFERHSTSKIKSVLDLNTISSFGFRGEALPSIASVSHVEAISNDGVEGHRMIIDNGVKKVKERAARNQGTTISVSSLFLKTPARLKHIKNVHYETSIVLDTIQKFAMGNPQISFTLYNEDKVSFRSYGRNDLADVFHRVYGAQVTQDTQLFSAENYDFKIDGIMALPQHNRANRYSIWLYINNRMIRFPKIQKAIVDGYRRHMPTDRYPIVVMNIHVDPQLVDVNVHPSKWEIRLSKDNVLVELIQDCFSSILDKNMRPQRVTFPSPVPVQTDIKEALLGEPMPRFEPLIEEPKKIYVTDYMPDSLPISDFKPREIGPQLESEKIEPLTVLSQMSGCYILAQGDQGLYIIDQHAAMERVRYEYYQNKMLNQNNPTQDFLIPLIIEGRKPIIGRVNEINQILKEFQLELEVFGEDAFVLRSTPLWIEEKVVSEFIHEVLDMFEDERTIREEDLRRNVLATLACHSSVRFNEYMSMDEMTELVRQLRACEQPFNCPHGRPTFITVEHKQLIKEFKR